MYHSFRIIVVGVVVGSFLQWGSVRAANTWDGGGGDDNWSTGTNWDNDLVPGFPAALTFAGTTRLTPNNDLSNLTLSGISFASGAGAFTLSGNAVTLAGNVSNTSAQTQTIDIPVSLTGGTTVSGSASRTVKFSKPITGTGDLTVSGTGVQLSAQNSYSGDTIVDNGGLTFSVDQPNVHGLILENTSGGSGPTLGIGASVTATSLSVLNQISLMTIGVGTGKTFTINGDMSVGADPVNSNTTSKLDLSPGATSNIVINAGSGNLSVGANSTGSGTTAARLRLFGTGSLNFTGGEVRIGGGQADSTGNGANGELDFPSTSSGTLITADSFTVGGGSNLAAGSGLLNLGGAGGTIHTDYLYVGTQQSTGTVQTSSGGVVLRNRAGNGRTAIVVGNQDLITSASIATNGTMNLDPSSPGLGTIDILGSTLTIGKSSGGLSHAGTVNGTVKLGMSGTVNVTSIQMANNGVDGVSTQGDLTLGAFNFPHQGPTLVVNSPTGPGGGSFTLASNSSAGGSATGTFTIRGGTAQINTDILLGATTGAVSGTVNLQGLGGSFGGTLDMMGHQIGTSAANVSFVAQSGTLQNLGELNGSGTLTKSGTTFDNLVVAGTNTYTGPTFLQASSGRLLLNGTHTGGGPYTVSLGSLLGGKGSTTSDVTVNPSGVISPGGTAIGNSSIESLHVGSLDLDGTMWVDLNDSDSNIIDRLNVAGLFDLSTATSALSLTVTGTPSLAAYVIATYGSLAGTQFGTVANLPSGYTLDYHYNDGVNTNNIALVPVPEPCAAVLVIVGTGMLFAIRRRQ